MEVRVKLIPAVFAGGCIWQSSVNTAVTNNTPTDGSWYRAACLNQAAKEGGAIVQFVDYGNVETVLFECIVQMVQAFISPLPFLAIHTVLKGKPSTVPCHCWPPTRC